MSRKSRPAIRLRKYTNALGQQGWVHQTDKHRFYVMREGRMWVTEAWTLMTVGTLDPLIIADRRVDRIAAYTLDEVREDIATFKQFG